MTNSLLDYKKLQEVFSDYEFNEYTDTFVKVVEQIEEYDFCNIIYADHFQDKVTIYKNKVHRRQYRGEYSTHINPLPMETFTFPLKFFIYHSEELKKLIKL